MWLDGPALSQQLKIRKYHFATGVATVAARFQTRFPLQGMTINQVGAAMKPIGKQFSKITRPVYARHGHAWAGLLANWSTIVGPQLADISTPEKITWPGKAHASKHQKLGGTLSLLVAYGRALEVQHMSVQIIERINTFFGYGAIGQIKIRQGKIEKPGQPDRAKLPPLTKKEKAGIDRQVEAIGDQSLQNALSRLARGVLAGSREQ